MAGWGMRGATVVRGTVELLLFVVGSLVTLEVGYRAYLYQTRPEKFLQSHAREDKSIGFWNSSPWRFNSAYGFDYKAGVTFVVGSIASGRVSSCGTLRVNSAGSWGPEGRDYDSAAFKVLVVGDSMTAWAMPGLAWPDVLERTLSERLGVPVAVRNAARDGSGLLQMLDVAAGEARRLRPDLVIVAYTTDSITRARTWRREEVVDDRLRVFTSTSPGAFDLRRSVETAVISPDPRVTLEWCGKKPGRPDPIVRDIEERHQIAVDHTKARADLFTLRRSFAFDTARYGNPFYYYLFIADGAVSVLPRHEFGTFDDDAQTRENIATLQSSGAKVALVHIAGRTELKKGVDGRFPGREGRLLNSLERAFATTFILTRDNMEAVSSFDRIAVSPEDDHPSLEGITFYANMVARGLERAGLVGSQQPRLQPAASSEVLGRVEADHLVIGDRRYAITQRIGGAIEGLEDVFRGVELHGWAADYANNKPAVAIVAAVGSDIVASISPSTRRPDVEAGIGSGVVPAGFRMSVPLHGYEKPVIRLYALSHDDKAVPLAARIPPSSMARIEEVAFPKGE